MAALRSGLPRISGGQPWPPRGTVAGFGAPEAEYANAAFNAADSGLDAGFDVAPAPEAYAEPVAPAAVAPGIVIDESTVRAGLPRVAGGAPWPDGGVVAGGIVAAGAAVPAELNAAQAPSVTEGAAEVADPAAGYTGTVPAGNAQSVADAAPANGAESTQNFAGAGAQSDESTSAGAVVLRRGLPRVAGGEAWPAAGTAPAGALDFAALVAGTTGVASAAAQTAATGAQAGVRGAATSAVANSGTAGAAASTSGVPVATSAPVAGAAPVAQARVTQRGAEIKPSTRQPLGGAAARPGQAAQGVQSVRQAQAAQNTQAARAAQNAQKAVKPAQSTTTKTASDTAKANPWLRRALYFLALVAGAGVLVLAARGVTTLPGVPEFMQKFPGEYHSAVHTEDGFPAWARWTHYLNFFFMVLIVRSGLLVRTQQKPDAFYTGKKPGSKKVSIYLWLHTTIDLLWLANGVIFVVLLFVTGHWARIVPTSWEVFPNALSAALQYGTLEWPKENGWVNYNSLQQLMYFIIVFIAAPVAALTGVRMSQWWPAENKTLNKLFPAGIARKLHFPTMLFFVFFVFVHVFLVFSTGALRNLNHMFAGTDEVSWAGLIFFAIGLALAVSAWFLVRPLIIAPIANLTGKVSNR